MDSQAAGRARAAVIVRRASAEADLRRLRAAVLEDVSRTVDFDWYAWVLTDPRTTVGIDPLAFVPDLADLPRVIRLKYLTSYNRWPELKAVAVLGDRTAQSLLWREVQRWHGVADVASLVFADRFGCWAFLDLWSRRRFEDPAVAFLRELAPRLTEVIRRAQARTFHVVATATPPAPGPVVLLLDDDLRVVGQTAGSTEWLRVLLPSSEAQPIPACAYNVAAQLQAVEQGIDRHEPMGRVLLADGLWVTVRASRVEPGPLIAVTVEPTAPQDRLDVYCRAHGLTVRERELVGHLARGSDTSETAQSMQLSAHTVQDHLKAVFTKTGAHSRRSLLSFALGVRTDDLADPG